MVGISPSDDAEWQAMYDALIAYSRENNNDCNVRLNYSVDINGTSVKLGQWLATQRVNKKKGILTEKQEALLQV